MTLLVFLCLSVLGWTQAGTSTIHGTVTDPNGNVVTGATVTVTNIGTGLNRQQPTTNTGAFSFDALPPGDYKVQIEAKSFKKMVSNIHASVGAPSDASAQLAVGSATETVEVNASAASVEVNTQDATLGNNFVSEQITQLPLEARNVQPSSRCNQA